MKSRDILDRFFEISGDSIDSLVYLKSFRSLPKESFAVISIDYETLKDTGESFWFDLKLFTRLDLFPILHLSEESYRYLLDQFADSNEYSDESPTTNLNIQKIPSDKIYDLEGIRKIIDLGVLPVFISDNFFPENGAHLQEFKKFLSILRIQKLVFLHSKRLFLGENSEPVNLINLKKIDENFVSRFSGMEKEYFKIFPDLLSRSETNLKGINITTPVSLFKELFTIKGSGTLFRLGSDIRVLDRGSIEIDKIRKLLEIAFKKKVKEEFLNSDWEKIFLESDYRGAAILRNTEFGIMLSKFSVDEIARGEGIGREIWDEMTEKYHSFYWRAKKGNPINKWYIKVSDGMIKLEKWNMFWIGIDLEILPGIANYLSELPGDFYE
ncbi:MAG: hypothetical protein H7A24_05230 [Leptospiraceae bacterium]|nr:hypothetical protein [Leptospiraceae bacterium]MCP5511260.1 hypothetical protein [Leptospiraceae bacterium]